MALVLCPGCGGGFPDVEGPVHRYMTSSAGCWGGFAELLAADYATPQRMAFHQVVVDCYAAQHPGSGSTPQQVQSVGLHLMTLCLFLENGTDPSLGTALHRRMVNRPVFRRLERSGTGATTWRDVPAGGKADDARDAAYLWARDVWETYRSEQITVRMWLREAGFTLPATQE